MRRKLGQGTSGLKPTVCAPVPATIWTILTMLSQIIPLIAAVSAFSLVAAAPADDIITIYAPSLRPSPSGQPPKDVDPYRGDEALNNLFHLWGKIEGASAIGYGDGGGRWHVGVHEYSVTFTTTNSQFTTVTLPTPTSKTGA
jgi:hypothetical protein